MDFPQFLHASRKAQTGWTPYPTIIGLDPGETTGFCILLDGHLVEAGQLATETVKLGIPLIHAKLKGLGAFKQPAIVVYEDYRVYAWKTDQHTWATLHTPQMLGVIESLAYIEGLKTKSQMAQQPKQFCTDAKLKEWGYYRKGERHARDAIRHACYYLLFNDQKPK